jgi:hypothetical protein
MRQSLSGVPRKLRMPVLLLHRLYRFAYKDTDVPSPLCRDLISRLLTADPEYGRVLSVFRCAWHHVLLVLVIAPPRQFVLNHGLLLSYVFTGCCCRVSAS